MAQIPLSKAQLAREKENLAAFDRYLPALDLKRQQLMNARNEVRQRVAELGERLAALTAAVGDELPMLADRRIDLDGLVRLRAVRERTVNVAGVRMPALDGIEVEIAAYGRMVRPHWVDAVVGRLEEALRLRLEVASAEEALRITEDLGIPEIFSIEGELRRALLKAELDFVTDLVDRIRSGRLGGLRGWRKVHELLDEGVTFEQIFGDPVRYLGEDAPTFLPDTTGGG